MPDEDLSKQTLEDWARELAARETAVTRQEQDKQLAIFTERIRGENEIRRLRREDEREEEEHKRRLRALREASGTFMSRRHTALLGLMIIALALTLGTFGTGISLITTGVTRNNTTFAALGVVLLVVAVLAAGAGAWKLSGPGFEFSKQPAIETTHSPGEAPREPPAKAPQGPPVPPSDEGRGPQAEEAQDSP